MDLVRWELYEWSTAVSVGPCTFVNFILPLTPHLQVDNSAPFRQISQIVGDNQPKIYPAFPQHSFSEEMKT